jgi:alpha-L-rhamnosidase
MQGRIESDWKRDGENFTWKIVVPPNTRATVFVPTSDGQQVLESGKPASGTLKFVSESDGYAQFVVGAGTYQFTSPIA